ncbi:hypothetical protein [Deinococcus sp. AJ005]|uniref:hypothetical protein n=1 Tax=Deinococcus sp. AJ005 TaxID=2652443 RepID=UPI00125CD22F|nr:hypothetical protein [Deinococcus sp. AJ005]QFP76966.1 hypothetical protein DAAJ005_11250 [Deinococcus sp. AJ005]
MLGVAVGWDWEFGNLLLEDNIQNMRMLLLACLLLTACGTRLPDTPRGLLMHLGALEDQYHVIQCEGDWTCNGYTPISPGIIGERLGHDLTQTDDSAWEMDDGAVRVLLGGGGPVRFLTVIVRP